MKLRAWGGAVAAFCAASAAQALTIEYALDRAAALVACDEQLYRGQRAPAEACYRKLLAESTDTRIKADAARATGDVARRQLRSSRQRSRNIPRMPRCVRAGASCSPPPTRTTRP